MIQRAVGGGWVMTLAVGLVAVGPACPHGVSDDRQAHLDLLEDCWGLTPGETSTESCARRIAPRAAELGLIAPSQLAVPDPALPNDTPAADEPTERVVEGAAGEVAVEAAEAASEVAEEAAGDPAEVATESAPAPQGDPVELQLAAIAMYNNGEAGWEEAVEAALAHPELANAPNLCFAGIQPAYVQERYAVVLGRAEVVWANLDKGYLKGAGQVTSVCEYACRAGFQQHMLGQGSADGELWCRRWAGRLEREGASTAEAEELLAQME